MIRVGAYPTKATQLTITWSGCWEVLAAYEGKGLSGPVTIDWRGWKLQGTIDPSRSDLFAGEPSTVIVGGLAWCTRREWRPFHDDRGLTARIVALSIAEQIGQTIEVSQDRPLGKYFVPRLESGGQILTRLYEKNWHAGLDGIVRAQIRPSTTTKGVTVLNYEPRDGRVTVYADRPDQVPVGAILPKDERLKTNRRITKVVASASGTKERIVCYTEAA